MISHEKIGKGLYEFKHRELGGAGIIVDAKVKGYLRSKELIQIEK